MTGFIQHKAKIKYATPMSRSIYVAALGNEDREVAVDIDVASLQIAVTRQGVYADFERAARIVEVAKETSERIAAYLTLGGSIVTRRWMKNKARSRITESS